MADAILAVSIADRLRRDILRGRLLPGAPIKERDAAAELGVSRTPTREAIRILAKEGLVVLRPSRSPVVARPTEKEIDDQVLVLLTLETLSGELACTCRTEADLRELHAIQDHMAGCYETVDSLDLFEIDMAFHTAVAKASHNEALAETHRAFLARLWRARYLAASQRRNRTRVLRHHRAILDAIEARDVAAVRAAIDVHLGQLASDIHAAARLRAVALPRGAPPVR